VVKHLLTEQRLMVIEHEGPVNASPWFTARDALMQTWRVRIEEVEMPEAPRPSDGKPTGYL
jgi:hypothetical protein